MEELPPPDVYEEEISYMPYQKSLSIVFELVTSQTASNGSVLDLMCGPGCLLGQISKKRRDLHLKGVDFDIWPSKQFPRPHIKSNTNPLLAVCEVTNSNTMLNDFW